MRPLPRAGGALQRELFGNPSEPAQSPDPRHAPASSRDRRASRGEPAPVPGSASVSPRALLQAPEAAPASTIFRHPQASREIRLGTQHVAYALTRATRRSVGLQIGSDGLSVRAPRWVSIADIEAVLLAKAGWVVRKLEEQQQRASGRAAARIEWRDGVELPYLGGVLTLRLAGARATGPRLVEEPGAAAAVHAPGSSRPGNPTLWLALPADAAPERIAAGVRSWLRTAARGIFEARLACYAPRIGVKPNRLTLSSARARWGSASASGAIRLNWRLVHFGIDTIDYVVAHELAHLREMNHGPRFWALVATVIPDVAQARRALKADVLPAFE